MPSLALSITTVPSSCLTSAAWVSTSWRAIESCPSSVLKRAKVTRALASCASSRWRWPLACISASSNGRASMVASRSPARTIWPSLNNTFSITPETCGLTFTVDCGVTVPSASKMTGRLLLSAVATPTVEATGPRRPPAAPGAPFAASGCVRCHASQPVPPRISSANRLPTTRLRRLNCLRGVASGPACGVSALGSMTCPCCPPRGRACGFLLLGARRQRQG